MSIVNYAFIKNSVVVNIAVFESPSTELLNTFKSAHELDDVVLATEKSAIGGTYDGEKFWLPKPFPSWVKNEANNEWEAPIPKPAFDVTNPKQYDWDEDSLSWIEVV